MTMEEEKQVQNMIQDREFRSSGEMSEKVEVRLNNQNEKVKRCMLELIENINEMRIP